MIMSKTCTVGCLLLALTLHTQAAPLMAGDPILLPGTQEGYDFIRVDTGANRLLLGHEGNKSFDVFDIASKKLLKVVPTGTSQDATTDVNRGCYYVSGNDTAAERWVIDPAAKKIVTTNKVDGSGVEDLAFDPEYKHLYQAVKGKNTIAV